MSDLNDRLNKKSADLKQKAQEELESREDRLLTAATITRDTLFNTYEAVKLDDEGSVNGAVDRFEQCTALLNGQAPAPSAAPAPASVPASPNNAAPFDYTSLSEEQRQIIDMVVADRRRFTVEPSGAVKDKQYTKLNRNYQAEQAAQAVDSDADEDSSATPPAAKKAASPAPAKKATPPAKSAQSASSEEPAAGAKKPSLMDRAKAAGKAVVENTKQ